MNQKSKIERTFKIETKKIGCPTEQPILNYVLLLLQIKFDSLR